MVKKINLSLVKKAYFVGIKGAGMTALAEILKSRGIQVSGSDQPEVFFTDQVLKKARIKIKQGFNKKNIPSDADLIIVSAAYLAPAVNNPEVAEIKKRGWPFFTYAQVLGLLFQEKYGIGVAGTHGKTTTTAMLGLILEAAGLDPTVIVGSMVLEWQSNARSGKSSYLVAEADEYQNHFLNFSPRALILTSIEYDHPDFFKNFAAYQAAFQQLVKKIPTDGFIVANFRDKIVRQIVKNARCRVIPYGLKPLKIKLKVPGEHNLLNGAAAAAAAQQLGVKEKIIKKSLANFKGTRRRFEIIKQKKGIVFVDDFAHHPTEIKATLAAARNFYPNKKIWAIFQPHTFTRTQALLKNFGRAFQEADRVIILDIFGSAREKAGQIHSRDLIREIKKHRNQAEYFPTINEAAQYLKKQAKAGEIVLMLGAGDVWKLSTIF